MRTYDHKEIEEKWQKKWVKDGLYKTDENSKKPKSYVLDMFPYPSGAGLHVGHPKGYVATDIYSRFKKMNGFNILHPMGFDAFGLPAENYAIKTKTHPREAIEKNIANFKDQLSRLGFNYDWGREVNTTDPEFYKWTQWMFLEMYKKGLAYESYEPINWCPVCKTGLASEDLENGLCEQCGSEVEKKPMRQWVLKIREYADRLLLGLDDLDWPESIKESQRNWIGRSEGAEITFPLDRKYHYVILHGAKVTPKGAFYSWLKRELEAQGHTVEIPELPNPEHPNAEEQVEFVLKNVTFDENTIVVAHSFGTVVAASALERAGKKIAKLVLTAGFTLEGDDKRIEKYLEGKTWSCDYEKVRKSAGSITVLEDVHDDTITPEQVRGLVEKTGGKLIQVEAGRKHFTSKEEPIVLKAALSGIAVFTTRPDTLFGATYVVLAPEHPLVQSLKKSIKNWEEVSSYVEASKKKTEIERTAQGKKKTGEVLEGIAVVNPGNGESLPVFIADYVLIDYGTGAIMAVPAHDERDREFAEQFHLPIKPVIEPVQLTDTVPNVYEVAAGAKEVRVEAKGWQGPGKLIHSGEFNGMESEKAGVEITKFVGGEMKVSYKLRDWVFSRQRYWGEPIPIIHCGVCGAVPVPEGDLPVTLPEVDSYEPTGTGESPLADIAQWVNVPCPKCGGEGKRETNTMPQWAGSSWYYLRYIDPKNTEVPVDKKKEKYWSPVDLYVGGAEHATRHLIYARFWHKFLHDIGVVNYPEPFSRLQNVGLIQAEDGRKMSKRWGNVINPNDVVERVGADTLRVYEMFMGPFGQSIAWSTDHMVGARRFLERVWKLGEKVAEDEEEGESIQALRHRTIKKVEEDISAFKFNTAISSLMVFSGKLEEEGYASKESMSALLRLLAPFAPHLTEELWHSVLGEKASIHLAEWPHYDEKLAEEESRPVAIQVNGKVRGVLEASAGLSENEVMDEAKKLPGVKRHLEGKDIVKTVFIAGKILNIVVK